MAAFPLRLNLAMDVNHHFLENEYGDLLFFSVGKNKLNYNLCIIGFMASDETRKSKKKKN